jgi:hypothetical protein
MVAGQRARVGLQACHRTARRRCSPAGLRRNGVQGVQGHRAAACLFVAFLLVTSPARAQENTCSEATLAADKLRDIGKLLDARKVLARCSVASCPQDARIECVRELSEIASQIPSVVVSARDANGRQVFDGAVVIDGIEQANRTNGAPIELDPGRHTLFVRSATGGSSAPVTFSLRLGDKALQVEARLRPTPEVPVAPTSAAPSLSSGQGRQIVEHRPVPLAAYLTGGLALLAGASWAYFGLSSLNDYNILQTCKPHCNPVSVQTAQRAAVIGDASAAVALGAAGATAIIVLTRPVVSTPVSVGLSYMLGGLAARVTVPW